tara:strand:+ start:14763 stop:15458 length:696 start_codon:yes stop_codon:yes gene_type:complete
MPNTTEGIIFTCSQTGGFNKLPEHIEKQLNTADAAIKSLPQIARKQFIEDVKKAIGDIDDLNLPLDIRSVLSVLLSQAHLYLKLGHEKTFIQQCEHAIQVCGQGWSYLSYWVSTEQSLCYSIFWGLKAALEKHNKHMALYLGSQNDGKPQNDDTLPNTKNKNITRMCEWRRKYLSSQSSTHSSSKLLEFLTRKAQKFQQNLHMSLEPNSTSNIDRYLLIRQRILINKPKLK